MKAFTCLFILMVHFLSAVSQPDIAEDIIGKWVRVTPSGPVTLEFKSNGLARVDFNSDGIADVTIRYQINADTIRFIDEGGAMCPDAGVYKMLVDDNYLAFDMLNDMCGGRLQMTMGFWTKPVYEELIEQLSAKLTEKGDPELYLTRARVFMATGQPQKAKADFDIYIEHDDSNARAFLNRAGTRFPDDMEGAVFDCNKVIALEPQNKNAWFLRGLALFELGEQEKACDDFMKAIELGFSILQIAEEYRCKEFWKKTFNSTDPE